MRAAVLGRGKPGIYNLAGPGQLTVKQLAEELGWHSLPVPGVAVDAVAELVGRLGFLPAQAQWIARVQRARDHGRGQGPARASLASPSTTRCRRCVRRSPPHPCAGPESVCDRP